MRHSMLLAVLPAFALSAAASAATGETGSITAVARSQSNHSWLNVSQPAADGRYQARIVLADLDLTSADGWSAARARVDHAAHDVCDMVTRDGDFPGYPAASVTDCLKGTGADMRSRLETVRAGVMAGRIRPELARI